METRWVFGMVSLEFEPPRPIFYVVENRNRETLQNLIVRHCRPGTIIQSDEWRAYRNLRNIGYVHRTVNHSRHFVNPVTGNLMNVYLCSVFQKYGLTAMDSRLNVMVLSQRYIL